MMPPYQRYPASRACRSAPLPGTSGGGRDGPSRCVRPAFPRRRLVRNFTRRFRGNARSCPARECFPGSRGREAACQCQQQAGSGSADGDVGFAVAALDGDAGRGPRDQPLAGAGQPGVGGLEVQALAISAQFPSRASRASGDEAEPFARRPRRGLGPDRRLARRRVGRRPGARRPHGRGDAPRSWPGACRSSSTPGRRQQPRRLRSPGPRPRSARWRAAPGPPEASRQLPRASALARSRGSPRSGPPTDGHGRGG